MKTLKTLKKRTDQLLVVDFSSTSYPPWIYYAVAKTFQSAQNKAMKLAASLPIGGVSRVILKTLLPGGGHSEHLLKSFHRTDQGVRLRARIARVPRSRVPRVPR